MQKWMHGNHFTHVAWVVPDLRRAVESWQSMANVGPFFVAEHVELTGLKYLGKAAHWDQSVAFVQSGPMQVELIEQHCDTPSPFRDAFARGRGGVHHIATIAPDLDAAIERYREQGSAQVMEVSSGGVRVAMFDTRSTIGLMTEVIEDKPAVHQINELLAEAAKDWNGERPIRTFTGEESAVGLR